MEVTKSRFYKLSKVLPCLNPDFLPSQVGSIGPNSFWLEALHGFQAQSLLQEIFSHFFRSQHLSHAVNYWLLKKISRNCCQLTCRNSLESWFVIQMLLNHHIPQPYFNAQSLWKLHNCCTRKKQHSHCSVPIMLQASNFINSQSNTEKVYTSLAY
jgi:hypothetical protein